MNLTFDYQRKATEAWLFPEGVRVDPAEVYSDVQVPCGFGRSPPLVQGQFRPRFQLRHAVCAQKSTLRRDQLPARPEDQVPGSLQQVLRLHKVANRRARGQMVVDLVLGMTQADNAPAVRFDA